MDDKHISMVDADGVALAAIQGLNQKLEQDTVALRSELHCKDAEIQQLKQRLDALENILVKQK
jgi:polyhydroxyalkanoate synthesis regulator phasin